jgi:hypothetical protein
MQQILTQQMFQAADTNGDGVISKAEFENFYRQFMGSNSTSESSATAAADELYQQLNVTGHGLTLSQFASAVKLMISQKVHGQTHHQHGAGVSGAANNAAPSQSAASSASNNSATWLKKLLASANQTTAGQTSSGRSNGGMEFMA